jgi:anti-anti-sigma factor
VVPVNFGPDRQASVVGTAVVEVDVTGELDASRLPHAGALLEQILTLRPRTVVFDLTACPYLDAAAIGWLLDIHRRLYQTRAQLVLREPSPRLRRLLQVAHVDDVLTTTPRRHLAEGHTR